MPQTPSVTARTTKMKIARKKIKKDLINFKVCGRINRNDDVSKERGHGVLSLIYDKKKR